jgi:hypothetical protein
MKPLTQIAVVGVFLLAVVSTAVAQQTMQPVVRLGNFMEVANDAFIHIIATADIRYATAENYDFESEVRDRVAGRNPNNTSTQGADGDTMWAETRIGVDGRYQKNLTFQVMFEQQIIYDGNLIDDRHNNDNPGGTDVFGRDAETENNGPHIERYWIDYKFAGTPLRMRVGADLWKLDQVGIVGDDDPRFALFGQFGNFDLTAAAVVQYESQRLGLENDNDTIYYTFSGGYTLKPHRFQLDVVYARDRFTGADTAVYGLRGAPVGWTGQKQDSVLLGASWSGQLGPVRGLLQGNLQLGTARGGTTGLPAGIVPGRDYDIFAGAAIAYVEVDFNVVRPFVGAIFGTADGDPRDRQLRGFAEKPFQDTTQIATGMLAHLNTSPNFQSREYSCPARLEGVRNAATAATGPYAIGRTVTAASAGGGFTECSHTVTNPFNQRLGNLSHVGIRTTFSNPGTLVGTVGLRVFPLKGHEITGWYVYRGMVDSSLLEIAFAPELAGRSIDKDQIHEFGGFWMWTLNPHFDIRLAGNIAFLGSGFKDLARLSDCDPRTAGLQPCEGDDLAMRGEVRFRARF